MLFRMRQQGYTNWLSLNQTQLAKNPDKWNFEGHRDPNWEHFPVDCLVSARWMEQFYWLHVRVCFRNPTGQFLWPGFRYFRKKEQFLISELNYMDQVLGLSSKYLMVSVLYGPNRCHQASKVGSEFQQLSQFWAQIFSTPWLTYEKQITYVLSLFLCTFWLFLNLVLSHLDLFKLILRNLPCSQYFDATFRDLFIVFYGKSLGIRLLATLGNDWRSPYFSYPSSNFCWRFWGWPFFLFLWG